MGILERMHTIFTATELLWNACTEQQRDCLIQESDLDMVDTKLAWDDLKPSDRVRVITWLIERRTIR